MKGPTRFAFTLVGFAIFVVAGSFAYSTARGYTSWYFRVPLSEMTVDGKTASGWLHRGNEWQVLFVTRNDAMQPESYMIVIPQGAVSSCANWVASRLPAFPIGDVNPPCVILGRIAPEGPPRNLVSGPNFVEFTADDYSRVKLSW
jgi:hypothetical protein